MYSECTYSGALQRKELLMELRNLKIFSPRKAAGKWHPDKHQGVDEKKRAERIFMHVAAGYEVFFNII